MKHGDLIITNKFVNLDGFKRSRKAVVLSVSKKEVDRGVVDVHKPGLYAFYGFWHGTDPLNPASYGKCIKACGRVVGRIRTINQTITRLVK